MEFQINTNNVILIQHDQVESGEYNVTECTFNFSNEYNGLTKKTVFTGEDRTAYLQTIVNNKCSIPSEILATSQVVQIGVYAYAVENEELILRYSPEPTQFYIHQGSYKEAQNSTPPTPSEIEQLQAQITSNKNDIEEIQGDVVDINQDIVDIKAEQITQNENIQTNANNISTINEQISDINETITNLETNKANVTDLNALTERVSTNERDIDTIDGHISDINQNIDDLEQDLTNYSLITETGSQIELNINSSDFKFKAILKDKNGNTIYTSNIIDLPLETMVVGASYDNTTKEVILTLQNGTTLRFSVADLVSGLVSTDELTQVLSNYYNKTEVNNLLANHYTKSETDTLLDEKANQTSLDATNQNVTNLIGRVSTNEEDIADIKAEQTTQNTNIEELQNQVETLQEDLESANSEIEELNTDITNMAKAMYKVDGQGSDITLPNTSENKFVEFGLEGRTEQDGEPTPETPISIKNVTGNANVKIQNKNLLNIERELGEPTSTDFANTTKRFFNYNTYVKGITGANNYSSSAVKDVVIEDNNVSFTTVNGYYGLGFPIKVKPNTNYYFSVTELSANSLARIMFYDKDGTYLSNVNKGSFTTPSNCDCILVFLTGSQANTTYNFTNLQIEQGTTATSYVEHQEQNYPFTFTEGQRGMQGTQLLDDGIHQKRKQKIYDGTENWLAFTSRGKTAYYINLLDGTGQEVKCSHFICQVGGGFPEKNKVLYNGTTNKNIVFYTGDTENKLTEWKAFLAEQYANGTPVIVEYELAESELENNIIPYNETQQAQYNAKKQAQGYNDQTNISSTSDELGFNMNVVAVADANKVIDSELQEIKSAVIALGGDLNV